MDRQPCNYNQILPLLATWHSATRCTSPYCPQCPLWGLRRRFRVADCVGPFCSIHIHGFRLHAEGLRPVVLPRPNARHQERWGSEELDSGKRVVHESLARRGGVRARHSAIVGLLAACLLQRKIGLLIVFNHCPADKDTTVAAWTQQSALMRPILCPHLSRPSDSLQDHKGTNGKITQLW